MIMNKILKNFAFAVIASLSLVACTEVDLCTSEEHPHLAVVELDYDWNGVQVDDSMIVMPYRITPDWSCVYICSPNGATGRYISNAPDSTVTNDTLKVKAGELRFLTFNYDEDNKAFSYKNALSDTAINRNCVSVEYKTYKLSDPAMQQAYGSSITKFTNLGSNYVLNGDMFNHIYSQYTGITEIVAGVNSIEFAPKSILNNYEFNLHVSAQDVTVDKIVAHLSGVPCNYNLTYEKPEADSTAVVIFDVNHLGAAKYSGSAVITGLLRAEDAHSTSGAGILALAITVSDAAGNAKVYKVYTNLYNYIPGLGSLLHGTNREFDIDAPVIVTNDGVDVTVPSVTGAMWYKM